MPKADERQKVGGKVHCLAVRVSSLAECSRRFGSLAKQKYVNGVIVAVVKKKGPNSTRSSTYVKAKFDLGGHQKQA